LGEEPKPSDHPKTSYLMGFFVVLVTFAVLLGVLYHLTLSPDGPGLLKPIERKFLHEPKSPIMDEVRRVEELEEHRHFHHIIKYPQIPEEKRPACYICHSDYPHSKNIKVRSLLNMHTQYFVCESCHIKEREGTSIFFKWYSPFNENPPGPFLGTSYDPETGNLAEVEDKFSKIAPYFRKGVKLEPAILEQDAPVALDYMRVRDKLSPEQREGIKNKFHVDIKPKGFECNACHSEKSILDFSRLGFADNRIVDLEQMNIKGMLTKYEQFYLPDLFKQPEPEAKK